MSAAIMIDTTHERQHSMNGMEYSMQTVQRINCTNGQTTVRALIQPSEQRKVQRKLWLHQFLKTLSNFLLMSVMLGWMGSSWASSTSMVSSPNPSSLGQAVTLTVTVSGNSPSGTVTFKDGSTVLGSISISPCQTYGFMVYCQNNPNVVSATFSYTFATAGTHSLTAAYGGNGSNAASSSAAITQTVKVSTSATTLTVSANPSSLSQAVTFNATVTGYAPSGTVTFKDGATVLGTGTVAAGRATFVFVFSVAGAHNLTASYGGDGNNAASSSAAVTQSVNKSSTSTTLSTSSNPSLAGQPVTLTASVTGFSPSGTIIFKDGTTTLGTGMVTASVATLSTTFNIVGVHSLSVSYAGDVNNVASTSAVTTITVIEPPTVSIVSPANNSVSVTPGSFVLTATATSNGSTIAKVDFYANIGGTNTLIGTATTTPFTFIWSKVAAGSYSLTTVATDALGNTSTSAAVKVTSDQGPVVTLTGPTAGAQITSPNNLTLTANATSASSTITKVDFYSGSVLLGTATTAPYNYTWTNVPVGSYSLTAVATDALGTATTSAATTVSAVTDQLPTVSIASPGNGTSVASSFTLTANASSSTSTIAKVDYYSGTTLIGTATTAPYSFIWSSVPLGTYTITAVATDALNITATSGAITLIVNSGVAQPYYIYSDQIDTPRQITDAGGNVVWQWDNSDPFGNNPPNENPSGQGTFVNPLRFPGQYADKETNTYYNINRDYDPSTGRYVESDPIGLEGGINTFTYVGGNTLSFIDPDGLVCLYSQGSGEYKCFDNHTTQRYAQGEGWSGQGAGRNNHNMQNVPGIGPIPRGCWKVASVTTSKGPNTIVLQTMFSPDSSNNKRDLNSFRDHGANRDPAKRANSSEGCIIMGSDDRAALASRIGEIICVY